jgi:signal transduction histidine kinase
MAAHDLLIVDDDSQSRKLLEGYLKPEGYRVRSASSGQEALRMAEERAPDVALVDVMMPGMTGLELCQALKGSPATRLTQVMLVTALDGTDDRVEGLDTGADDYVSKPVQRDEFLAKVRALIRARRLLEELDTARQELEMRNRELELKKTLAQTLVHDMKNPLTAVSGNLELLSICKEEKRKTILERARGSLARINKMVMDLIDVECLEDGGYAPDMREVDFTELVREAAGDLQAAGEQNRVEVRLELEIDPCPVEADAVMLRRILDNLVANAVSHSPEGASVSVTVSRRPEGIHLGVRDDGPGVPEEHRESVFDKYARLDLKQAGITRNRGLGLTFCRLAVEAHGGTIWVGDAPGGGALFEFILPECTGTVQVDDAGPGSGIWIAALEESENITITGSDDSSRIIKFPQAV